MEKVFYLTEAICRAGFMFLKLRKRKKVLEGEKQYCIKKLKILMTMKKLFLILNSVFCILNSSFAQPSIQWQRSLGGTNGDASSVIQQTIDGGFVVAGWTNSNDGEVTGFHGGIGCDDWIVQLNSSGNIK